MHTPRTLLLVALAATTLPGLAAGEPAPRRLRVAADHRHLETTEGHPFFYLGDTAWKLFSRLGLAESRHYLADRAAKGFTVIQAVLLAPDDGLTAPNAEGNLPLLDRDPTRPNDAYFAHVDAVVQQANAAGLVVGLLPAWGQYWKPSSKDCIFDAAKARAYGSFLGHRYRDAAVIWILGGDQDIESPGDRAIVDAFAAGLRAGDQGAHLITYHPRGPGASSASLPDCPWLDFNMEQSSHGAHDHDNGLFIEHDYALDPPKPALDGEPRYEMLPVGFYYRESSRLDRFDDADVRQAAYWAVLAGACGHVYGNNNVWQFWQPGREPQLWANQFWSNSLDTPGAFQMGVLRRLFESRPWQLLEPAPDLLRDAPASGPGKVRAACARDGSFAFVYSPRGENFTLDRTRIKAARLREVWFDPRYGVSYEVHVTNTHGYQTYAPPTSGRGQDWVLLVEDAAKGWPLPGGR
ncbi:MAG TPA: glycoside hydrolase family 140 protein [Lacunisphaera sp.]|nr:glycoside hydrolase family 140 protein [Lacunisphaera sp.]